MKANFLFATKNCRFSSPQPVETTLVLITCIHKKQNLDRWQLKLLLIKCTKDSLNPKLMEKNGNV